MRQQTSKIKSQSMTRMQISLTASLIRRKSQFRGEAEEATEEAIAADTEEVETAADLIATIEEEAEEEVEGRTIITGEMILIPIIAIISPEKTTIMISKVVMTTTINDTVISSRTRTIPTFIRVKMIFPRVIIKMIGNRKRKMHFSTTRRKIRRTGHTEVEAEVEEIVEGASEVEEKEEKEEAEVREEVEAVIEDFSVNTSEEAIMIDRILEEVEAAAPTGELVKKSEMKKLLEKSHRKISNSAMKTANMRIRNLIKKSHTTKTEAGITTKKAVAITTRRATESLGKE